MTAAAHAAAHPRIALVSGRKPGYESDARARSPVSQQPGAAPRLRASPPPKIPDAAASDEDALHRRPPAPRSPIIRGLKSP